MKKLLFLLSFLPCFAFGQSVEFGGQANNIVGLTLSGNVNVDSLTVVGQSTFKSSTTHLGNPSISASSTVIVAANVGLQIGDFTKISEVVNASKQLISYRITSTSGTASMGISLGFPNSANTITYALTQSGDGAGGTSIYIVPYGGYNIGMFGKTDTAVNREVRIHGDLSSAGVATEYFSLKYGNQTNDNPIFTSSTTFWIRNRADDAFQSIYLDTITANGDLVFVGGSTIASAGTLVISTATAGTATGYQSIFIATSGFVGVGVSSPIAPFSVGVSGISPIARFAAAGNSQGLQIEGAASNRVTLNADVGQTIALRSNNVNIADFANFDGAPQFRIQEDADCGDISPWTVGSMCNDNQNDGNPIQVATGTGAGQWQPFALGFSTKSVYFVVVETNVVVSNDKIGRIYIPTNGRIIGFHGAVSTAPTGSTMLVDINKNDATIFTTQGNRPTFQINSTTTSVPGVNVNVNNIAANDFFTIDVDQIGSTVAGGNLVIRMDILPTK